MSNDHHIRLSSLLKELIATFVRNEANSNPLITITNINLSPDEKRAIIFFTTIPNEGENDALIYLKRNASEVRNYLKKKARVKNIPHLIFMIDAGERHRQHMDELVRDIANGKKQ